MINHFPTTQAAEAHLNAKGFTQLSKSTSVWVSADSYVEARVYTDPHRGPYIQFREVGA